MDRRHALGLMAGAAWTAGGAQASTAPARAPVAADWRAEIDLVGELLFTLHPGLTRYATSSGLMERLVALRNTYAQAPDLSTRYRLLSRLLATLRCGHSYANFFNQSRAVAAELFDRPTRLPFHFRWLRGQMVVTGGQSPGLDWPAGTVIESIDGQSPELLWWRLQPYARVDGYNEGKARDLLSLHGRSRIEFFDVFHGLEYGRPAGGYFRVTARDPDGVRQTLGIPALDLGQRNALMQPEPGPDEPQWSWNVLPDGTVHLVMPGWAVYNSRWDWEKWLTERLDELARDPSLRALVVDVRGNEGGLNCGDLILERYARAPLAGMGRRLVRYRRVPSHLNPVLETWDERFRDWGDSAKPVDGRFFELPSQPNTVMPRGLRIQKPLAVLIDAANSSATFNFALRVRETGLGPLVGQTTGGSLRGINGGAFFFVRLPVSGLEFDLPLIGFFPPGHPPDGGLVPDVAVMPTADDVAHGRDVQLAAALRAVRSRIPADLPR